MRTGHGQKVLYLLREDPALFDPSVEDVLLGLEQQKQQEAHRVQDALPDADSDNLQLRRRIAEVQRAERVRTASEMLYLKVCSKLEALGAPLIPTLRGGAEVDFDPVDLPWLVASVYPPESQELLREHVQQMVAQPPVLGIPASVGLTLYQVGMAYAYSATFGYYLRRVGARYRLERAASADERHRALWLPSDLREYSAAFTFQAAEELWKVGSVEAQRAMKEQVLALFGDLGALKGELLEALRGAASVTEANQMVEAGIRTKGIESIRASIGDLQRMAVEAVSFGALLYDAEREAEAVYALTPSAAVTALDALD